MKVKFEKKFAIAIREKFGKLKGFEELTDTIKEKIEGYYSDQIVFDLAKLKPAALKKLYELAQEQVERSIMMHISILEKVRKDPKGTKLNMINAVADALVGYLADPEGLIDGWLYFEREDGYFLPYVVTKIYYTPPAKDRPASVTVTLNANIAKASSSGENGRSGNRRGYATETGSASITFYSEDLKKGGGTPQEILQAKGYYRETPELRAQYDAQIAHFKTVIDKPNQQFWLTGRANAVNDSDNWWNSTSYDFAKPVKTILDEGLVSRPYADGANPEFWRSRDTSAEVDDDEEADVDAQVDIAVAKGFDTTPIHPMALVFHLDLHEHMWTHTSMLKEYVYKPEIKEKLVLPQDHIDLIELLAEDMDVLLDDIVEGKSGGTTILCQGQPGLGKTLTAEVFSEVIGKPLYKVNAGLLGVSIESVEKGLNKIFKRAERWGAVLLLDEADVYIRQRGDDMAQNAVVAAFLRTIEYFHGLFFMTTNRVDDVDDAILSRCIATVKFEKPSQPDLIRLWQIFNKQFEAGLTDKEIARIAEAYPTIGGRDVKNLLKLFIKFAKRKQLPMTLETVARIAAFRGL